MKTITVLVFLLISLVASSQTEPIDENGLVKDKVRVIVTLDDGDIITPSLQYPILDITQQKGYDRRRIYFLHGLSGDGASWTHAASAFQHTNLNRLNFQARECETTRLDYSLSVMLDLYTAADKVREEIDDRTNTDNYPNGDIAAPQRSFIIAHSQGGVVSRALLDDDFITDPPSSSDLIHYGGLVTVSSPLQGAQILNNMPFLLNMADDACNSLSAGPVAIATTIDPLSSLIIKPLLNKFVDNACEILSHNVLPLLFADKQSPITNHYKVGAAQISTLDSNATNSAVNSSYNQLPKIAFYGYEPEVNLFWRTSNWMVKSPNTVSNVWDANDDLDLLQNTLIPLRNKYVNKVDIYNNKMTGWAWATAIFLPNYWFYHRNKERRDAWQKGVNWLDNRADIQWKTVIGARVVHKHTLFECLCHDPYNPWNGELTDDYVDCLDEDCAAIDVSYITVVETKQSDGVVLTESSMNLPGATHAPIKIQGEVLSNGYYSGSSHMQIRNDKGIKDGFINLLDGDYGQFFYTETK